jgi:adenosylcobinamide-phosphate guanylyltransferase
MDALVMCGGLGTRLGLTSTNDSNEKPLLTVCGQPMLDRVVDTLTTAQIDTVYAVVSPHTPETAAHARDVLDLPTIETPGEGYVADLDCALSHVDRPVLTVVADLPLLDRVAVDAVLARVGDDRSKSLTVCVPVERKRALGVSVDTYSSFMHDESDTTIIPSGLNIVAECMDEIMIRDSYRLAVNVNRPRDGQIAEALCG